MLIARNARFFLQQSVRRYLGVFMRRRVVTGTRLGELVDVDDGDDVEVGAAVK